MPAPIRLASLLATFLLVAGSRPAGGQPQRPAHVPTEQELRDREEQREESRTYQRDQVESVGGRALRAAGWVKDRLSGFHVTPTRLMVGLGLVGVLFTWSKNKRKTGWAVATLFSWLLLLGGVAALALGWPQLG